MALFVLVCLSCTVAHLAATRRYCACWPGCVSGCAWVRVLCLCVRICLLRGSIAIRVLVLGRWCFTFLLVRYCHLFCCVYGVHIGFCIHTNLYVPFSLTYLFGVFVYNFIGSRAFLLYLHVGLICSHFCGLLRPSASFERGLGIHL